MSELIACSGCRRHVRATEDRCPFCGADVDSSSVVPTPTRSVGRLVFIASVGFVLTGTACAYGAPSPHDAGADAADAADASDAPAD